MYYVLGFKNLVCIGLKISISCIKIGFNRLQMGYTLKLLAVSGCGLLSLAKIRYPLISCCT